VAEDRFRELMAEDFFAEHFRVHLYHYGTPRQPLERVLRCGGVMLLDVDVQGASRLKQVYPDAVTIFVLPPSIAELRRRLKRRGTETQQQLRVRFENAKREMQLFDRFEYAVTNDNLDLATRQVLSIIEAHFCRTDRLKREQTRPAAG
jgi:guanylate kinase